MSNPKTPKTPYDYGPGPCIWCGQYVTSQRKAAGCPDHTADRDPAWATEDGDYGCDRSPETGKDGTGDHARPFDVERWTEQAAWYHKMLSAAAARAAVRS